MANSDKCPNCDNIYGNEPRKIPCGHIVCHKCCLDLFSKENNTLICPVCDKTHAFKSKNTFKKSLQQVPHFNFGKKTSNRDVGFSSHMPMENSNGIEKISGKEMKKIPSNNPMTPPGAPPETTNINPATLPPLIPPETTNNFTKSSVPPPPVPLMGPRTPLMETKPVTNKSKVVPVSNGPLPSLLQQVVQPTVTTPIINNDVVTARCHGCGEKCEVTVCEHCDHFVCLKCAEKHKVPAKPDPPNLLSKWNNCKQKYQSLKEKIDLYNLNRKKVEQELATIKVAVELRTQDATQTVINQQNLLLHRIEDHIQKTRKSTGPDHNELLREFQTIQNRLKSALNGEDIGVYHREDFLRDISQLQERLNQRRQLIETQSFTIPTISRCETIPIEKILGELRFSNHFGKDSLTGRMKTTPFHYQSNSKTPFVDEQNKSFDSTSNSINTSTHRDMSTVKPLMADINPEPVVDNFEKFRRMAAQIHQIFNAPYSKVINAASTTNVNSVSTTETNQNHLNQEKQNRTLPTTSDNFVKSWKSENTAVPSFLCMTALPTPKLFVADKHGKVSVCSIPPKASRPVENHTLFAHGTDECIESVVASSRFLIVYSRKRQDTMTGTMYFFTHDCKIVPPVNGIHQSIPVHHILCDQAAGRLYCLDRMRCTIYYHPLPNNPGEIENCMKTRCDFIQLNTNFIAFKMFQNDLTLGVYLRSHATVYLYDKKSGEKIDELKCDHFADKFESWGIIALRKDNNTLIFKVDECGEQESVSRQHIVYEVNRQTKQVISKIQLSSVFGMILGPNKETILGIRLSKDSGLVQCYMKK